MKERSAREKLSEFPMSGTAIETTFRLNANVERNIIDATNLWLENCLLYQEGIDLPYSDDILGRDDELLIDLYIYGYTSKMVSLLSFCKKFPERKLFYGINKKMR